jgi:hypothetical protein
MIFDDGKTSRVVRTGSGPGTGESWAEDAAGNRYSTGPFDIPGYYRGETLPAPDGSYFGSIVRKR